MDVSVNTLLVFCRFNPYLIASFIIFLHFKDVIWILRSIFRYQRCCFAAYIFKFSLL